MKTIFITGATGLVGANSALEFLQSGYAVRLLVRDKALAQAFFAEQGFDLDDFVVADMLDKEAVKEAMQGCDAVLHCAAAVNLDPRQAEQTMHNNLASIDAVIGSACELGIEKILYVSSMSVFYDFDAVSLNEDSPLVKADGAYSASKIRSEEKIRAMQRQGHPIITSYPAAVLGPNDPKHAESNDAIVKFIKLIMPITSSGYQLIDARDIAIAHRLLLESEHQDYQQARYIIGGHYLPWPSMANLVHRCSGMPLRRVPVSGATMRMMGRAVDFLQRWLPDALQFNTPISTEAMQIVTQLPPASSERLLKKLPMQFRPAAETLTDTFAWLRKKQHL